MDLADKAIREIIEERKICLLDRILIANAIFKDLDNAKIIISSNEKYQNIKKKWCATKKAI